MRVPIVVFQFIIKIIGEFSWYEVRKYTNTDKEADKIQDFYFKATGEPNIRKKLWK